MNKKLFILFSVMTVICVLLLAVGCDNYNGETPGDGEALGSGGISSGDGQQEHVHTYAEEWSADRYSHWHTATCGHDLTADKAEHNFDENDKCVVCNYYNSYGFSYELNSDNDSYTIKGLEIDNDSTQIVIPSTYKGKPVTGIGSCAFQDCSDLISVSIPTSVVSIGSSAFEGCRALESIEIPFSVSYIGFYAFENCVELTSVVIPSEVKILCDGVFKNCSSLESVEISSGVTRIGMAAFYGCRKLKDVEIPLGLTDIGQGAFAFCESLTEIVIPIGVTKIQELAFVDCPSLTIYCELSAPPSGWETSWNGNCQVEWDYM